jgi:hypothetical protein
MENKLDKYWKYLKLTDSERQLRIKHAEQDSHPSPNPQGEHVFPLVNFIEFKVLDQHQQLIQLTTYKYPAKEKPKALVIMFHGLNSHIGHGAHIAHQLA